MNAAHQLPAEVRLHRLVAAKDAELNELRQGYELQRRLSDTAETAARA